MAAKKMKDRVTELQTQIRKLADNFDKEREKQVAVLEKQLEKARAKAQEEIKRQRENLKKLEKLQEEYRVKANDALKKQIEKARKAVDDARDRVHEFETRKALLEAEVKVLKATAKGVLTDLKRLGR